MRLFFTIFIIGLTALVIVQPVAAQSTLTVRAENDVPGPVVIEVFTASNLAGPLTSQGTLSFSANDNSCSNQSISIPSNTRTVRLVFTNDFFNGTGFEQPTDFNDRNAIIDWFEIDGRRIEGENFSSSNTSPIITAACGGTAVAVGVTSGYTQYEISGISVPVPTMTEWGMIILMVLVGLGSVLWLKRQRAS